MEKEIKRSDIGFKIKKYVKSMESELEFQFKLLIENKNLPSPIREYKFCPTRKWRFDFAWPGKKVAVELEGAIWTMGRHTRGLGFVKDCEKYNEATKMGWKVLRYTANNLNQSIEDLKKILC